MQTKAYFDNIHDFILQCIKRASKSLHLITQDLPTPDIISALNTLAANGTNVKLLCFTLEQEGSKQVESEFPEEILERCQVTKSTTICLPFLNTHCLINGNILITGPQGCLTTSDPTNHHFTTIKDNDELTSLFLSTFKELQNKYSSRLIPPPDLPIILPRLESLRQMIRIQDQEDIDHQLKKLKKNLLDSNDYKSLWEIVQDIESAQFSQALANIATFIDQNTTDKLPPIDPEAQALELKILESQLESLEHEKMEVENLLTSYQLRHAVEVGDLIKKVLLTRCNKLKEKAEKDPVNEVKYHEAKSDYDDYCQDHLNAKKNKILEISEEEKNEIKALFRSCSKMCHPDMVPVEIKSEAKQLFSELCEANQKNDLHRVKAIHQQLEFGLLASSSKNADDAATRHKKISIINSKVKELIGTVYADKKTDTYKKISSISNWDDYFSKLKQQLHDTLKKIEADSK